MKVKYLLRFYFSADKLDRALDNLIMHCACASGEREGIECAERLCRLIGEKSALGRLWSWLDGKMCALSEEDLSSLRYYAAMRVGLKRLSGERRRELKRAVVKFSRRIGNIGYYADGVGLVGKYYCLLG